MKTLRIATRKSRLALWQAEDVKRRLLQHHPQLSVELIKMTSRGDVMLDAPLAKVGGKGLFVKELETAMLQDEADIAVHSMKDVPMSFPQGLGLAVICEREDCSDAFVSNHYAHIGELPEGATLGTSSLRRQCQILAQYPHLNVRVLRGNVNTRLAKLDAGEYDAIILATAGLIRLSMADRITARLTSEESLPAGGQGAVGIETRSNDREVLDLLKPLNHSATAQCVIAERAMNRCLEGGCQVPIACFAMHTDQGLFLRGLVGRPDGSEILRAESCDPKLTPEELGIEVAKKLLDQGAGEILKSIYQEDA